MIEDHVKIIFLAC